MNPWLIGLSIAAALFVARKRSSSAAAPVVDGPVTVVPLTQYGSGTPGLSNAGPVSSETFASSSFFPRGSGAPILISSGAQSVAAGRGFFVAPYTLGHEGVNGGPVVEGAR